jgi:ubiquinol-cytochrome c reductase cytochrome b subunit
MYPRFMLKSLGLLLMVTGVLALLGGLAQNNPIWQYGPYDAYKVSYAAQPDWYMGWIEGAMRLFPDWQFVGFGHTVVFALFVPAVVMPVVTFFVLLFWPLIDSRISGDRRQHQLLQRPRENPVRTAIGAGILTFYAVMFIASSDDLVASFFAVDLNAVVWTFRIVIVVLPWIVGYVVHRICRDLERPRQPHGDVVLVEDRFYVFEELPEPDGHKELDPIEVPSLVKPGPVSVAVPQPVHHKEQ